MSFPRRDFLLAGAAVGRMTDAGKSRRIESNCHRTEVSLQARHAGHLNRAVEFKCALIGWECER
jgi:hypothetical protein